jgi:hypothetical protein
MIPNTETAVAETANDTTEQNQKIRDLWRLLEELGRLGVQIGVSGSIKNGYSVRIKFLNSKNR